MRLNQNNPAAWMGGKLKAFESAMGLAGGAFHGFHDGRFRLGGPWKDGAADGDGDGNDREESWKAMLDALFGEVPEGEETPPPCDFLMVPAEPAHRYFGVPAQLPPAAGRVEDFPFPVRNQFDRGACFAFAMTALCEHGFAKRGRKTALSEQSLYCFTKQETRVEVDEQADGVERLRDAVRAVEKWGIAPLEMWPYDPNADGWNFVNYAGDCAELVQAAAAFRWGYWKAFQGNSVAELKEWLAKGHPVCIGVRTTPAWQAGSAVSDGTIPYFPQHWRLLLDKASALRAAEAMREGEEDAGEDVDGEEPEEDEELEEEEETESDGHELLASLLAKMHREEKTSPEELLKETQKRLMGLLNTYTGEPVVYGDWEDAGPVVSVPITLKATGGHAVCLVGYQDDEDWAGGGYFVMRNSWGEAWGWREHPGHGRIPYEYMVQMGQDAYAMLYEAGTDIAPVAPFAGARQSFNAVASEGKTDYGTRERAAPSRPADGGATESRGAGDNGFSAWCKRRMSTLQRPLRDASGVMLRPGTPVLVPNPDHPTEVLRDTPENRATLRAAYESEIRAQTEAEAAEKATAFLSAVREVVDGLFSDGHHSVCPDDILAGLRRCGFPGVGARELRSALLDLQSRFPDRYVFGVNRYGDEEVRPAELAAGLNRITE